MNKIYLDNSATTQMDPKVIEVMAEANKFYGNPSSIHTFGQEARKIVDDARDTLAGFLDCTAMEVIFTNGGSESDNLAIRGIIDNCYYNVIPAKAGIQSNYQIDSGSQATGRNDRPMAVALPHVVTTTIEHHAVLHTVQELEKEDKIEVTYIEPNESGIVSVEDIEKSIKPTTRLVSVMYVNNEIGTVQPIREIGKLIEKINLQRCKKGCHSRLDRESTNSNTILDPRAPLSSHIAGPEDDKELGRIYFHTDAVQAAEFFNMDVKYLHVDLLTLTAHKIHGPKGAGALFIKKGTPIRSQITGGDQEFKKRAGTENVASIAGFAEAIESIQHSVIPAKVMDAQRGAGIQGMDPRVKPEDDNYLRIQALRDKLENFILKNISDTYLNGDKENRAPHITNISFKNAEGEAIILNLDFLGIAVSSGSACTAHSLDPSHVLTAIKVSRELSHGAIRFSLSKLTTEEEIDRLVAVLPDIIKKLRDMSPFN